MTLLGVGFIGGAAMLGATDAPTTARTAAAVTAAASGGGLVFAGFRVLSQNGRRDGGDSGSDSSGDNSGNGPPPTSA